MQAGMLLRGQIKRAEMKTTHNGAGAAMLVEVDQKAAFAGIVTIWIDADDSKGVPPVGTWVEVPGVLEVRNTKDANGRYVRSQQWHPTGLPVPLKRAGA
jgi:hypothetical protein